MKLFFNVFAALLIGLWGSVIVAQSELASVESLGAGWNTIATDGLCSAGTAFQFNVKPNAASNDVLVFFNGGGACWFGEACDLTTQPNIHSPFADMDANKPQLSQGIFDFENPENPFADHTVVFIPYCTGDVHMGSGEKQYTFTDAAGENKTLNAHHDGYHNTMMVLDWLFESYPQPNSVVLSGSSAGAVGSSFYAGLVAAEYSATPVVLLADAAGGYGSPHIANTFTAWDTASILPDWSEYEGKTNANLSFEDFYIASANHNENLSVAQYNAAEDQTQILFTQLMGDAPGSFSLPQRMLNNYLEIESAVENFSHYTAGGDVHMIMQNNIFYQYTVEGVRFVDWVESLINGKSVDDISCVNELTGCIAAPSNIVR